MLQNMKDFDFQIKKNKEDIVKVIDKVDGLSKDLDDLVSLYEIVSEQMNPFVGLSKVTKKRLDALENITADVDTLKTKIGEIESLVENCVSTSATLPKVEPLKPLEKKTATTAGEQQMTQFPNMTPATPSINTTIQATNSNQPLATYLPDAELDNLLSKALESYLFEQKIDTLIDEFFRNIK